MNEEQRESEIKQAHQRAQEARESWRKARDEMREAVRRARESRRQAKAQGETYNEEADESLRDIIDSARDFAREIGQETRRLANDAWDSTRHEWETHWRDQWQKSLGKDWREHWVFGGRRFKQWSNSGEETNPFVAAILSRGGGLLSVYVLHLLNEQPRHGNDVMRQIEMRTAGSWTSNPGAIYPLLSFMEEKQLVRSKWEDPDKRTRRVYQITEQGKEELARLRRVLQPKVMEAIEVMNGLYDDLYGQEDQEGPKEDAQTTAGSDSSGTDRAPVGRDEMMAQSYAGFPADEGWREKLERLLRRGPRYSSWPGRPA